MSWWRRAPLVAGNTTTLTGCTGYTGSQKDGRLWERQRPAVLRYMSSCSSCLSLLMPCLRNRMYRISVKRGQRPLRAGLKALAAAKPTSAEFQRSQNSGRLYVNERAKPGKFVLSKALAHGPPCKEGACQGAQREAEYAVVCDICGCRHRPNAPDGPRPPFAELASLFLSLTLTLSLCWPTLGFWESVAIVPALWPIPGRSVSHEGARDPQNQSNCPPCWPAPKRNPSTLRAR